MPSLIKLDISGNNICFIPNTFAHLLSLEYFNFSDNKIERFPYFLGYLPSLQVLYCQRNPFQNISKEDIDNSSSTLLLTIRMYLSNHSHEYNFEDEMAVDNMNYQDEYLTRFESNGVELFLRSKIPF